MRYLYDVFICRHRRGARCTEPCDIVPGVLKNVYFALLSCHLPELVWPHQLNVVIRVRAHDLKIPQEGPPHAMNGTAVLNRQDHSCPID